MRRFVLALPFALLPSALLAHPHMFLDTAIEVMFNDAGQVGAVRITWVYDDLSSLQYIADLGLDMDGDGSLTAQEKAKLTGFDMNWDPGFPGDSYVLLGGVDLGLSRPRGWTADYQGGKIITSHIRDLPAPVPLTQGQELIVQVYDPGFYAAYSLTGAALSYAATPRACSAQIYEPDVEAADKALLAALAEYGADEDIEADFPAIGAAYAEEVRVACVRVILVFVVFGELVLVLWATGRFGDLAAWIMAQQQQVQTWLAGAIRALRAGEAGALAGFLTLCFAYGVLHAAGPGHGKLVIGGYGVARAVTARRLALLSLLSSMAQATVAVVAVYAIVAALGLSRQVAGDVVERIMAPLGSAALAGLGLYLVWRGARRMSAPKPTHDHGPDCECGHTHGPSVQQVQAAGSPREVAALIAGIAMRPCTGAVFVLILTWQLGLAMAGIAGAFAMGFGTALFTAAVAIASVAAREGALGGLGLHHAARVLPVVEITVGLIIALAAGRAVLGALV